MDTSWQWHRRLVSAHIAHKVGGCGLGFREKIIHHVISHVLCMQQQPALKLHSHQGDREVSVLVPANIHIRPLRRDERGVCQADCICLRLRIL